MKTWTVIALCLALAGTARPADRKTDVSRIGNRGVGKGVNFYSIRKEIALGRQLAQEVRRQARIVDDPVVAGYVDQIGQSLVRNSDAHYPFTFQVIDDDSLNAFALPGGYVFINSGLIQVAEEEDELAGTMAHEIAHVAARHMTRQATKSALAKALSLPLGVLFGGWAGAAVRGGTGAAIPIAFLNFTRADESEADYLGVQYMYSAGYDPNGIIGMFEKLQSLRRAHPGLIGRVFATHPPDIDRIRKTQAEIEGLLPARTEYVVTTSAYAEMRERLAGLQSARPSKPPVRPALRKP